MPGLISETGISGVAAFMWDPIAVKRLRTSRMAARRVDMRVYSVIEDKCLLVKEKWGI
jgi:hypothetical protein